MNGCPFCDDMKNRLNEENIEFTELDIHEYQEEYGLFKEITENEYVPSFMVMDTNGLHGLYAPDRDYQDIKEGVEIIKRELLN